MDQKLKDKILREQDSLIYFSYNYFEECLFIDKIDEELDMTYSGFNNKFFSEYLEIIPELKTKNLLYLLTSTNRDVKEEVKRVMKERTVTGEEHFFSGENAKAETFGYTIDLMRSAFSAMGNENIEIIKQKIFEKLDQLEIDDPYAYSIIRKAGYITSMDNFFAMHETGIFSLEKLQLLEKLSIENPNILDMINYKIFEDSIFEMGEEFISKISRYPNLSNKLIMIAENNPKLLEIIKQGFSELEDKGKPEILEIQSKVITYAARNFPQIEEISFENLVNSALMPHETTFDRKHNNIHQWNDAEIDRVCDEQYKELSQGIKGFKYSNHIPEKKKILLKKYFGMDKSQAEDFCNRFMHDIDSIELIEGEAKEYLERVKNILKIESEAEIDELYASMTEKVTPYESLHYKYVLREAYSKTYVRALDETEQSISQNQDTEFIEIDGKQVKKINLRGDFNLLVHSTDSGFKGDKKILDGSFAKSWRHISDPDRHMASCCYITQDFLGHVPANENGMIAVFTKSTTDDISLMGPTDIDSNIKSFDQSSNKGRYIAAKNMPQNARRVYSEIPVERRDPDYLLIFDDTPEQVLQNSYKAAAEFGIPLIYIDKLEVEKMQLSKLDELSKTFKETQDLDVLSTLISMYETNVAGWLLNRNPEKEDDSFTKMVDNERFRSDFETRETIIYEMVEQYIDQALQVGDNEKLVQIASIMQTEIEKYDLANVGKTPISQTKMKFDAQSILEQIRPKLSELLVINNENIESAVSEISFTKLAENISKDDKIGKTEVDKAEEQLNIMKDKEVSFDD